MLNEGQASITRGDRTFVFGEGTKYRLLEFEAWTRTVRTTGGERAWAHGSWASAEWHNEATIPILIEVQGTSAAEWDLLHRRLAAAFAPIETGPSVELRWRLRGTEEEKLVIGRPRSILPKIEQLDTGNIFTGISFVAPDPTVYSGELHTTGNINLPMILGGLIAPWTAPIMSTTTITAGRTSVRNAGDRKTGLRMRVTAGDDGVEKPVITLTRPDGIVQTLRINLTLGDGDYLDIDTATEAAVLNGTASRREYVVGDWPILPGTDPLADLDVEASACDLSWTADVHSDTATLSASWRDAYST